MTCLSEQPEPPKKVSSWRRKHEEFISTIRAAKGLNQVMKDGGPLPPPPPPSYDPGKAVRGAEYRWKLIGAIVTGCYIIITFLGDSRLYPVPVLPEAVWRERSRATHQIL